MFPSDGSSGGRFIPKHILDDNNNPSGLVFCLLFGYATFMLCVAV